MDRACRRFRFSFRPQATGHRPVSSPIQVSSNQQPASMFQSLAFRTRLLIILAALALVPAVGVTIAWSIGAGRTLPLMGEAAAWERVGASGSRALEGLRGADLTPSQRAALQAHERELSQSLTQARRLEFLVDRFVPLILTSGVIG